MKKPSKQSIETFKTVVIVALIVAIAAFVAGIKYQQRFDKSVELKASKIVEQQAVVKTEQSKQ